METKTQSTKPQYQFAHNARERGVGDFGLWIYDEGVFFPAAGELIALKGLNEFSFALVKVGKLYSVYNVETGILFASADKRGEAKRIANAKIAGDGESRARDLINYTVSRYGVLPKREANPKPAPNLAFKSISRKYRKSIENADKYFDEEIKKNREEIGKIRETNDARLTRRVEFLQKEISDVESRKSALRALREATIYAAKQSGGGIEYQRFEGALYNLDGISFGIYRNNNYFYVVEAESGAIITRPNRFFFAAFNEMLDYLKRKTPQELRAAIDKRVADYGRSPFNPNV
jgi:hypothetical protein